MLNLIDIVVILIIVLTAFIGYKRGFIKTVISLSAFFIAIIVSLLLYKPVAVILTEKTSIDEWIKERVMNTRVTTSGDTIVLVTEEKKEEVETSNEELNVETEEEKQNAVTAILSDLPNTISQSLNISQIKENAKQELANKLSELIMNLLSLIVIFLLVRITLIVAEFLLNSAAELPVIKQINEVLGMTLGGILGLISTYFAFAIITLISSITDISFVVNAIKSSLFASVMFENNIIFKLLS